ncbi:serine protease inhibitor ecotin [Gilliamella mensalis]|uniref:serine protease inhibitor ecotin n=1 Tax=Gilliamella mensalis TaxID=1908520 RepID=UPI000A1527E4|nr:serine protease inhibitor ecotin [Gilliamella mensalis]
MKKLLLLTLLGVTLTACANSQKLPPVAQNANDTAPFPTAQAGFTRYAIHLPTIANENNAKVEVIIGKEMNVDCNLHNLGGVVKQEELKGWGYSYYVVERTVGNISTLMACPEGSSKNRFVTINHNLGLFNYNSSMPLVFYVPNDLQVKYRVWQPNTKIMQASVE